MNLKKILLFAAALVMMCFTGANAANINTVKAAIVKHSVEMGVDPAITLSIARTESGYKHETRSSHGAVGVFQLMPSTARRMGLNPYSLDDNVKGGIMYYKSMYKMFGSMQLAVAAYNAGPAAVKKYKSVPPYRETQKFVSQIMSHYYYLKAHTDPAVIAYNKSVKKPAAVKKTTVVAQRTEPVKKELPKVNTSSHFVAEKAPVPVEKVKNAVSNEIIEKVFETELKEKSVDM